MILPFANPCGLHLIVGFPRENVSACEGEYFLYAPVPPAHLLLSTPALAIGESFSTMERK